MKIKELKPFDVISSIWLHHEGPNVVVPHEERLCLVPLSWIVEDDDEKLSKTLAKAWFRDINSLENKEWYIVGKLERRWKISGPSR